MHFYFVPVIAYRQKYLKPFANEYLKFTCMPNANECGHEDNKSIIFSTQDAAPYLSCICRRLLLTKRLL